jgi:hypothetical protein
MDFFKLHLKVRKNGRIHPFGAIQLIYENHPDHEGDFGGSFLWSEELLPFATGGYTAVLCESWVDIRDARGNWKTRIPKESFKYVSVNHGVVVRHGIVEQCGEFGDRWELSHDALRRIEVTKIVPFESVQNCLIPPHFSDAHYLIGKGVQDGERLIVVSFVRDGTQLLFREDGRSVLCVSGLFASMRYWFAGNPPVKIIAMAVVAGLLTESDE